MSLTFHSIIYVLLLSPNYFTWLFNFLNACNKALLQQTGFPEQVSQGHIITRALKGKEELAALTNVKMPDICAVLCGFCEREPVAATWLHFPLVVVLVIYSVLLLVRLGISPSAASFLFSKERPALLGQRRLGWEFSLGSNPRDGLHFRGQAGD